MCRFSSKVIKLTKRIVILGLGLKNLRTARDLKENMVVTVEPGCYFIDHVLGKRCSYKLLAVLLINFLINSIILNIYVLYSIIFQDTALTDPEIGKFFVPEKIEEYRGFGGVRIEDDIIITKDGCEVTYNMLSMELDIILFQFFIFS